MASLRICSICKVPKALKHFRKVKIHWTIKSTGEYKEGFWRRAECKSCERGITALKRKSKKYRQQEQAWARAWKSRQPEMYLYCLAKKRAKKKRLKFTIQPSDIIIPKLCPILKLPLASQPGYCPGSPSLDRVNNTLGYIPGNVAVISRLANAMKNGATRKTLQLFAKNIMPYVNKQRRSKRKVI